MPDIVLTTLNAKYIHAAFGVRYLLANMGELRSRSTLVEFDINQRPLDIAEGLLALNPKIIGVGIYIWNAAQTRDLVGILKRLRPDIMVILGGPEVSYEPGDQEIVSLADYVIGGEADLQFAELCRAILAGSPPSTKVTEAELPEFSKLALPYHLYTAKDLAHRVIYVEASRGCPFSCEFCLSSLDIPVRQAPLSKLLPELDELLNRGATHLKFVDRTFNLNIASSKEILEFCLSRYQPGRFFHFELVPDRLPESLRAILREFPPGALQLEVGVQTFNPEVAALINRPQNYARLEENLCFLRSKTGVHIHADLIAGLPGENLQSFAAGFDKLISLHPHEIQVGILKRLRGTPIVRHTLEWGMVYNPHPPYELLQNKLIPFETMQQLRRFARYWDLIGNSGNFIETTPLLWSRNGLPFEAFLRWSEWLYGRVSRTDSISLIRLAQLLFEYLTGQLTLEPHSVAETLSRDYQRGGRRDKPEFLKAHLPEDQRGIPRNNKPQGPKRQARHFFQGQ